MGCVCGRVLCHDNSVAADSSDMDRSRHPRRDVVLVECPVDDV